MWALGFALLVIALLLVFLFFDFAAAAENKTLSGMVRIDIT